MSSLDASPVEKADLDSQERDSAPSSPVKKAGFDGQTKGFDVYGFNEEMVNRTK